MQKDQQQLILHFAFCILHLLGGNDMKTKTQFTNRILSLVLALVMMVGLLPTISFTASAATAELFQGFDTYGITITSVYFALPNASNGSVSTIYGGSHVIYKATLELYIEGEPVNGKVTACFSFSLEDYLNGKKYPENLSWIAPVIKPMHMVRRPLKSHLTTGLFCI